MRAFKLICMGFFALVASLSTALVLAQSQTITAVEYYDPATRKFFLTVDPVEQTALESAAPETARVRTGLQFDVFPAAGDTCEVRANGAQVCAGSIVRFDFAQFDWWFYSPKPSEWAQLNAPNSGFVDRGVAFKAFLPDGPNGTCTQGRVAVYRSYRNQNHRFTADQASHQRTVAAGAIDEGITFCAERARILPVFEAKFDALARDGTRSELECLPPESLQGPCVATRNLQPPRFVDEFAFGVDEVPQAYIDRSGFNGRYIYHEGDATLSNRSFGTFVQFGGPGALGLHVNTGNRLGGGPVALDAAYNIRRFGPPGTVEGRLIPYRRAYDVPVEMSMKFQLFVRAVDPFLFGTAVRGRLRIILQDMSDQRFDIDILPADRRLDFVVDLYGNNVPAPDSVALQGQSVTNIGRLVVTTNVERSTYGHLVRPVPFLFLPGTFRSANFWGMGDAYDYRIDRAALQRIINAARQVDPTYSSDISMYQVLGYRIENEIEGEGRLGVNQRDITLQLLRTP